MPLRPYDQDQIFLLPPSLNEWVRDDNPARVFSEIIDRLDTTAFRQPKEEGRPAYNPAMMIKVLLWGYATGVRSSRKIEEKLQQDVVFMWLAGLEKPGFRTLCLFRTNNSAALEKIFTDVIIVAKTIGMGALGLVALEGLKNTIKGTPEILVADTGYAGGENFKYLEENKIDGYIHSEDERHIGSERRQKAREHLFTKKTLHMMQMKINTHVRRQNGGHALLVL